MGRFSLAVFLAFGAILIAALYLTQFLASQSFDRQRRQLAGEVAEREVYRLADGMRFYSQAARQLAADPELARLLRGGSAQAIKRRAEELKHLFPGARGVALLPTGLDAPDPGQSPPLSFACLDMIRAAEQSGTAPPIEVHVFGTPHEHIDLVHPVTDGAGKLVGHMRVALEVDLLQRWLSESRSDAYLELTQPVRSNDPLLLARSGPQALRGKAYAFTEGVEGTRWQLGVWLPVARAGGAPGFLFWSVLGAALALAALAVFVPTRVFLRILRGDLNNLLHLATATLRGTKRHDYPLRLKEFKLAALTIGRLPQEASMERERDDAGSAAAAQPAGGEPQYDLMYMDKNAFEVEELDADAAAAVVPRTAAPAEAAPQTRAPAAGAAASAPVAAPSSAPAGVPASIFKAYDIRGVAGKTLTADHIRLIGRALGSEAAQRGIDALAFGRDGRRSGPELGLALVEGLRASGINVLDVGQVPTPVLYYAAVERCGGSGVMLTGSHNPPEYNGLKMMLGGETLAGEAIQGLHRRITSAELVQGEGTYQTESVLRAYVQRITGDVKLKRPLKLVVDCGNGVAGVVAPALYKALGCEVHELYCEVDGGFPNHHPDPSQPENLQALIAAVKQHKADLGFAFDGDGDRLGVVSSDGRIIWPDRQLMLFAADVLSRNPGGKILFDVKCSSNLARAIQQKGGQPIMWKTGHSLIKAKMKEIGAPLGGEMSGHIFIKDRWYGFDDALYAGARLLEILAADLRPPRVVFAGLPDTENTPELRLPMAEERVMPFMEELLSKDLFDGALVTTIDGLRVDFEDGWGLVRASNTTPCLVLRFEGKDKQALARIQEQFRKALLAQDPSLSLPF